LSSRSLTRSQTLRIKSLKSRSTKQESAWTSSGMNYPRKTNRHFETGLDESFGLWAYTDVQPDRRAPTSQDST
jgi:hypothetical protein